MAEVTRLSEQQALAICVLRGMEQTPGGSAGWRPSDAKEATQEALALQGRGASFSDFLARRAQWALDTLRQRGDPGALNLQVPGWPRGAAVLLCVLAFVAGGMADYLETRQQVKFLEFHLLGLIAWNVVVYGLTLAGWVWAVLPGQRPATGGPSTLFAKLWFASAVPDSAMRKAPWFKEGQAQWATLATPLAAARLGLALHAAAMAFALGLVLTMYARGLPQQYSSAAVTSTWLDAAQIELLFNVVMSPGAQVFGLALPRLQDLAATSDAGLLLNLARQLFHLNAAALLVWVLLPRLALWSLLALQRWRRQRAFALPLNAPYFTALRAAWRREDIAVAIVPFRYDISPAVLNKLNSLVQQVYGQAAKVVTHAPVLMGEDAQDWKRALGKDGHVAVIVVFNATATAEASLHAALLKRVRDAVPRETPVLALVDIAAFPEGQEARLESRRQQWRQVLDAVRARPLFLNLGRLSDADKHSLQGRLSHHD
ncbi:hypothetical protein [Ideonella sp.]|uniref:hypothetical protein n=1 Tax=Ideonella sp. TaxID=1929293 RepID=UPI0037C14F76